MTDLLTFVVASSVGYAVGRERTFIDNITHSHFSMKFCIPSYCNINMGISEEVKNKVYNTFDIYFRLAA